MSGPAAGHPLVVGLAALNEAATIAGVAEAASEGLARAFPDVPSVLVLADNGSVDGTSDAFQRAEVASERVLLETGPGVTGKGHAVRLILDEARRREAFGVVLLDADLRSARPEWIGALARPLMDGYSLVTPVYLRDAKDGAVTRHVAYPLLAALTGLSIQQPIGGDFAVSDAVVSAALERSWPSAACGYGVDMFLTLVAIRSGGSVAGSRLGAKVHKPSAPKLVRIFREVGRTAFELAAGERFGGETGGDLREVDTFGDEIQEEVTPVSVHVGSFVDLARTAWQEYEGACEEAIECPLRERLGEAFASEAVNIDERLWHDCLLSALVRVRLGRDPEEATELLLAPFLGRTASFWEEVHDLPAAEVDRLAAEGGRRFRELFLASGSGGGVGCRR